MGWSRRNAQTASFAPNPESHPPHPDDVIEEIKVFWRERVLAAQSAGIAPERIALDAGFGFGKSVAENLAILRRGRELAELGFPMLSGTSRKSTIGRVLGGAPVEERLWGTAATVALAIAGGCDIVRVHDVQEMVQVARVADAIVRGTAV
jgi:dihydropteroate synthase